MSLLGALCPGPPKVGHANILWRVKTHFVNGKIASVPLKL